MLKTLDQIKKLHTVTLLRHSTNAKGGREFTTLSEVICKAFYYYYYYYYTNNMVQNSAVCFISKLKGAH